MVLEGSLPSGRERAIETLIDMEPQGAFYRAARVLVRLGRRHCSRRHFIDIFTVCTNILFFSSILLAIGRSSATGSSESTQCGHQSGAGRTGQFAVRTRNQCLQLRRGLWWIRGIVVLFLHCHNDGCLFCEWLVGIDLVGGGGFGQDFILERPPSDSPAPRQTVHHAAAATTAAAPTTTVPPPSSSCPPPPPFIHRGQQQ